jgi:PAS domain-containing protein
MQALLSNPDIIRAVQSGDYSVLVTNPAFLRLLNNPRVQEIGKRMQ